MLTAPVLACPAFQRQPIVRSCLKSEALLFRDDRYYCTVWKQTAELSSLVFRFQFREYLLESALCICRVVTRTTSDECVLCEFCTVGMYSNQIPTSFVLFVTSALLNHHSIDVAGPAQVPDANRRSRAWGVLLSFVW